MAHRRERDVLELLKKRIRLWPVLGVVGVRQCGKSLLLRELLAPCVSGDYHTMDSKKDRERATRAPESFSAPRIKGEALFIDEIQKVPDLFDAIKLHVDERRRPGMYVISGSTEFSRYTGVRESLTGRIGLIQLYPLNCSELHEKKMGKYFLTFRKSESQISLTQFDRTLERGGMPGICFLRTDSEFSSAVSVWIETTCQRDISRAGSGKFDGELAQDILSAVARQEEPTAAAIAIVVGRDRRVVQRYLDAFTRIFVLRELRPHQAGVGKSEYILCDSGIAHSLGANRDTQLRTFVAVQALSTLEYHGFGRPRLEYYRNEKSSRIPVVISFPKARNSPPPLAIRPFDGEAPTRRDWASLIAFQERARSEKPRLMMLTHTNESYREGGIDVCSLRG
ncbi:MAG: ATP-binding protein [Deltaproteobacteria bacterium]|nr:ATP-binding protein [Deltaproteobacteria bacterium]MBI3294175.1 ATP-binding protein [Deltaproteobacteria bacterium]